MIMISASVCFALSILLFGIAFEQCRRSGHPAWLTYDLTVQVICVAVVTLFAFGCGFLVKLALARQAGTFGLVGYGSALGALAVACLVTARLVARGRHHAAVVPATAEIIAFTPPPTPPAGDQPLKPHTPRRPRRKAA